MDDHEKFWRETQRPGTTLFGRYKPRTLWQRFYDWCAGRPTPQEES